METESVAASFGKYGRPAVFLGLLHACFVLLVNKILPEPYMDEIFHIDQTRRYCAGNTTWNPMITTPPALYIVALPLCEHERYTNSFVTSLTFIAAARLRSLTAGSSPRLTSLAVLSLPVLLHSSLLFYTDLLSLCSVLWSFSLSPVPSALFFAFSLLSRQTNIIWAFFYAVCYLFSRIDSRRPLPSLLPPLLSLFPFILLASLFLIFLVLNDFQIVLGDAAAHQAVPHFSQLLYFSLFSCMQLWPQLLPFLGKLLRSSLRPLSVFLLLSSLLCLRNFSFAHPYLLADNRHITFTIHRRLLSTSEVRHCLAPLAVLSLQALSSLASTQPRFKRLFFFLCTALCIVPAHLLEFRYFIVPYVLYRISIPTSSKFALVTEIVSNLVFFSTVFFIFLFRPYEWPSEVGVLQRFMW